MADGLSSFFCPPPFSREWSVPIGRGRVVGEQMATPSFQCLPRWLPPPTYMCHAQDMGEPPHVPESSKPGEPGVYCSSQGCLGEIFYPDQLKQE